MYRRNLRAMCMTLRGLRATPCNLRAYVMISPCNVRAHVYVVRYFPNATKVHVNFTCVYMAVMYVPHAAWMQAKRTACSC